MVRLVEYFLFVLFSVLEFLAFFILMFSIFRFRIKGRVVVLNIILTSLINGMTQLLFWDGLDLKTLSPLVTIFIAVLSLRLLFKVQIFYALAMTCMSYVAYAFLQTLILIIVNFITKISFEEMQMNYSYILQMVTIIVVLILSYYLKRKVLHFSFIPMDIKKIQIKKINIMILMIIIVTIGALEVVFGEQDIFAGIVVLFIVLVVIGLIFIKKETEEEVEGI